VKSWTLQSQRTIPYTCWYAIGRHLGWGGSPWLEPLGFLLRYNFKHYAFRVWWPNVSRNSEAYFFTLVLVLLLWNSQKSIFGKNFDWSVPWTWVQRFYAILFMLLSGIPHFFAYAHMPIFGEIWAYGHMQKNTVKWGVPEKIIQNTAQKCWHSNQKFWPNLFENFIVLSKTSTRAKK